MLIALGRFVDRFGLSAVGVQYQQGLARCCAASDFAEGAIGNAERFPIPTADGRIVRTVGRPRKDNCGFDLTGLLAGSEGTLGVITEVEVVLHQNCHHT